jgi:hypothetical protein
LITDPTEIDGEEEGIDVMESENDGSDSDSDGGNDDILDTENIEESGRELENTNAGTNLARRPIPELLKGSEYTKFEPKPYNHDLPGQVHLIPTQDTILDALHDLKKILHPERKTGQGYKDPEIDLWRHARLEGMMSMLNMFTNSQSRTYNQWGASACQAAVGMGQERHCARQLCALNQAFLADREVLPLNPYGDWNESLLVNENIANEINIYLLSLGNEITAIKLMDFLHRNNIKEKYGIERDITHKTAC